MIQRFTKDDNDHNNNNNNDHNVHDHNDEMNINVDALFNLKMSLAVLKETMRVASIAPFLGTVY